MPRTKQIGAGDRACHVKEQIFHRWPQAETASTLVYELKLSEEMNWPARSGNAGSDMIVLCVECTGAIAD